MEKAQWLFILSAATLLSVSCQNVKNRGSYYKEEGEGVSVKIVDNNVTMEMNNVTDITLASDDGTVKTIPAGGFVVYNDGKRSVSIRSGKDGNPVYKINRDEFSGEPEGSNKQLLAEGLQAMIDMGLGAADRVNRISKASGTEAVMQEVQRLKRDNVKGAYLGHLLMQPALSPAETAQILDRSSAMLKSDYEKRLLLDKVAVQSIQQPVSAEACWKLLESIGSDYEKATLLKMLLKRPVSGALLTKILEENGRLGSDYEKGNVLKQASAVAGTEEAQWLTLLTAAAALGSDYEKSNVLIEIAKKMPAAERIKNAFMAAAKTIKSNDDYGRVMKIVQ